MDSTDEILDEIVVRSFVLSNKNLLRLSQEKIIMKLFGGIYYSEDGLSTSIRGMHLQTTLLNNINDNVTGFGKVGYQRKVPVLSSFAELIGANALSEVSDESVGRLRQTKNPLDFALAQKGYFQCQTPNGIKLTRDGRFKLDKNGYLLTLDDNKVLSITGQPVKLSKIPDSLDRIKVDKEGLITIFDPETKTSTTEGQISVVASDGSITRQVDLRQGFTEDSNVRLHSEVFQLVPVRRNFEANRQAYIVQNNLLTKVIQELGK
jgi:flagellar basal-body rod protein FlgF